MNYDAVFGNLFIATETKAAVRIEFHTMTVDKDGIRDKYTHLPVPRSHTFYQRELVL